MAWPSLLESSLIVFSPGAYMDKVLPLKSINKLSQQQCSFRGCSLYMMPNQLSINTDNHASTTMSVIPKNHSISCYSNFEL